MKGSRTGAVILVAAISALAAAAFASEKITYSYDARGRLVKVEHAGPINNRVVSNYAYDKADNRKNVTVTGAP